MNNINKWEDLVYYEGNGKTILLNSSNYHWVRMSKKMYDSACNNKKEKDKLISYLDKQYDLLGTNSRENNIGSVYFSVTGKCNMECAFCTMNSGPYVSTKNDLSLEEIKNILIPKLQYVKPRKIIISGGEPLVREDIVLILKSFAEGFGKDKILLQTNGLLLSHELVKKISPYVKSVEISIENIFANNSLQKKMGDIFQCIREEKLDLVLSFVLDDESRQFLYDAVDFCHKYSGVFMLRIVSMVGRAAQDNYKTKFSESIEKLKVLYDFLSYLLDKKYIEEEFISGYMDNLQPQKACGAYGRILAIHPDGSTFMCSNFKDCHFSIGNISKIEIDEIFKNLKRQLESNAIKDRFLVSRNKMCQKCTEIYFCPGPCRAEIEECERNQKYKSNNCLVKKAILRFNMYYYDRKKTTQENLEVLTNYLKNIIEGRITLD